MTTQPSARERLLDAAEELVSMQGVTVTPVDAILERARVSPATLYAHFGNKEGLITQALQRRLSAWDRTWQQCIDTADTPEEKVLAVFDALALHRRSLHPSRWCVFLGVTAEAPSRGPELEDILAGDTRLLADRLGELAAGLVGAGRSEDLAQHLVLVYTGVLGMILRGADADTAIADGRRIAAIIVSAFGTADA
ncbi:TetR/AcrR family transcriptional regulator [Arthrobacter sp. MDT1-48-3]